MSGFSFEARIDDREIMQAMSSMENKARDMTPAMKAIGEYVIRRTQDHFSREEDPEGKPWKPLSAATFMSLYKGRKVTKKGITKKLTRHILAHKILTKSHQLRMSITYRADAESATIGTNKIYARIHQLGGKSGRGQKITIPARPYLGINDADRAEAIRIMKDHMGIRS